MEQNSMTGDPNQQSPPSVFRFDSYPGPSSSLPWGTNTQQPKFYNPTSGFVSSPLFPNYNPPHPIHSPVAPQIPASFSFGTHPTGSVTGQFPFQITDHGAGERAFKLVLGKRKTDSPPLQPFKQHITEEKMAEHLSKLHISSETATSPIEPESVKNKRLYMCEEMRKLQTESLIPPYLMSQIQRPCTALVLWQPPAKLLPPLGKPDESDENDPSESPEERESIRNMEAFEMEGDFVGNMDMDS